MGFCHSIIVQLRAQLLCYHKIPRPYLLYSTVEYSAIYLFTMPIRSSTRSQNFLLTTLTTLDTCLGAGWACIWMTHFKTCMSPTPQDVPTLWSTWPSLAATALQPWWLVTTETFSPNHLGTWWTWSWGTNIRVTFLLPACPLWSLVTHSKQYISQTFHYSWTDTIFSHQWQAKNWCSQVEKYFKLYVHFNEFSY
jgi:hypothetical protein